MSQKVICINTDYSNQEEKIEARLKELGDEWEIEKIHTETVGPLKRWVKDGRGANDISHETYFEYRTVIVLKSKDKKEEL